MEKAITVGIYALTACIVGSFIESAIESIAKMNFEQAKVDAYNEGYEAGKECQKMLDNIMFPKFPK